MKFQDGRLFLSNFSTFRKFSIRRQVTVTVFVEDSSEKDHSREQSGRKMRYTHQRKMKRRHQIRETIQRQIPVAVEY